jgi:hypothetical protein
MRRSTLRVGGERETMSVCQTHEFRASAPLCGAHSAPPFLATTKVPSMVVLQKIFCLQLVVAKNKLPPQYLV